MIFTLNPTIHCRFTSAMKWQTIIIIVILKIAFCYKKDVEVETLSGKLRGVYLDSKVSSFYSFFGIPYATPPVNELRFKSPKPVAPWTTTLDVSTPAPSCIQTQEVNSSSEDCLILNIYTTDIRAKNRSVMVWLHGGCLENGTADINTYGPHYIVNEDVIVVTVQFRLGILGYLNLDIEDAPGNVGMMDAVQALRWLQENIEYFGGDPNSVTIAGQSSGSVMVHGLLLSPMSQGLFNQVILESSTALTYRLYRNNSDAIVRKIRKLTNETFTSEQLVTHLKELTVHDLLKIQTEIKTQYMPGYTDFFPFCLTLQKSFNNQTSFLTENPIDIIIKKSYKALPMLVGFTSDEGIRLEGFMDMLDEVNKHFEIVVPTDLFDIDDNSESKKEFANIIKTFYFGTNELSRETFPEYVKLATDSWYGHITDWVVRLQTKLGYEAPTFYYVFAVDGDYNWKLTRGYNTPGACHSDELGYLWHMEVFNDINANNYSNITRKRMVKLWTNFIKFGNPTIEKTELLPIEWKQVEYPKISFLLINKTLSLEESPLRDRMLFWQKLYGYDEI